MKKFFSLMLVAVLLVSALPFQAFAAEHAHNWKLEKEVPATCTTAGSKTWKCQNEGCTYTDGIKTEEIEKLGHGLESMSDAAITKEATCTTKGVKSRECVRCDYVKEYEIDIDASAHKRDNGTVTTDAKCGENGTKAYKCVYCGADMGTEAVEKLGHDLNDGEIVKAATCEETGKKVYSCTRTGCDYTEEETIPVSTIHNYVGNACSVCGKAKDLNDTASAHGLRFINEETDEDTIVSVRPGYVIDAPAGKKVKNMKFMYWSTGRNGTGTRVYDEQSVFGTADGQISATTFYAYYVEDKNDGLSYVDIIVRRYVNGKAQGADITLFEDIEFEDGDSIYDWLYAKRDSEIATKLFERVSADEYQWKNRYFYNYWSDEVMTKADLKADGSKAILIKVESLKSNAANVKLYLHKSSTSEDPFRILDMTGYTAGNYVSRSAVADLVEKYYSYKSIGNLYNEEDWEELMNGEDNNGRSKVLVEDNGYTEIHVVVTNANTKSNSKADSSNPKTGDYITIAVGTMALAAAAVVTLAELKKRKMI